MHEAPPRLVLFDETADIRRTESDMEGPALTE
jgi:hypothetical protein